MSTYTHSCKKCGALFSAQRSDAKYCSPSCRTLAYYGRKKEQNDYREVSFLVSNDDYNVIRQNLSEVYQIKQPNLAPYIIELLKKLPNIIKERIEQHEHIQKLIQEALEKKYGRL